MSIKLEIKRKEVEILKVKAARADQEFRVEEAMEGVRKLETTMLKQDEHVARLEAEIEELRAQEESQ
jgi:hypothetical protein